MSDTELIPYTLTHVDGLENALATIDDLRAKYEAFYLEAVGLEVRDAESYAQAGSLLRQVKENTKMSEALLSPFNVYVDKARQFLRDKFLRNKNKGEEIHGILTTKMADYDRAERQATAVEQAKLDKANKKQGAPPQTVAPNIPSTPGIRRTVTYKVEIVDKRKFILEFVKRMGKRDDSLSRFITVDEGELAAVARAYKDPAQMMKEIPWINCVEVVNFGGKV